MKICIVTDEISADPECAIELGIEWGVRDFELRGYFYDRVPLFTAYQQKRLKETLERYDARIVAISPGIFKIPLSARSAHEFPVAAIDRMLYEGWSDSWRKLNYHLNELLPLSLEYAAGLGVKLVVIFGFDRAGAPPGPAPDEALEYLFKAAEQAQAAGVQIAIENEAGFLADTGERTAAIIRVVNHPALGINWDPGNAFFEGDEPYPGGYAHVREHIRHVHFKDARLDADGKGIVVTEGQIDWSGQIKALAQDGYDGYVSIETHMRPKIAAARAALARLTNLIRLANSTPGS